MTLHQHHNIVRLFFVNRMKVYDIADIIGCSVEAVRIIITEELENIEQARELDNTSFDYWSK